MPLSAEFKLNSAALYARIEEIKKNPPPEILAYKEQHPEFKGVNCALLAAYAGVSEKTLTNLKLGKLTDCNCSTAKLVCEAVGLDIRTYLGMSDAPVYNVDTSELRVLQQRVDARGERIGDLEELLDKEQKESARLRKMFVRESRAFAAVAAALVVVIAAGIWLVYKMANPGEGIFRLK